MTARVDETHKLVILIFSDRGAGHQIRALFRRASDAAKKGPAPKSPETLESRRLGVRLTPALYSL